MSFKRLTAIEENIFFEKTAVVTPTKVPSLEIINLLEAAVHNTYTPEMDEFSWRIKTEMDQST